MSLKIYARTLTRVRQAMVSSGGSSSAAKKRDISTTIFIKGLPPDCTTDSLRRELEPQFGGIRHAIVFRQPENVQKANAMVDFLEMDSALAAQDELDQNFFMDKRVDVEFPLRERTRKDQNRQSFNRSAHENLRKPYRRNATTSNKNYEQKLNVQTDDQEVADAGENPSHIQEESNRDISSNAMSSAT